MDLGSTTGDFEEETKTLWFKAGHAGCRVVRRYGR